MLKMDPATLRKALEQLEEATYDHADWHGNLLRAIVCGLPSDPNDLTATAHLSCRFGRWYYERAPAEFREYPAFAAIGTEHERLHRIATRLLRDVAVGAPIVRADFEDLVSGSARLRVELDSLRREIEGALQTRDALTGAYGRIEMIPELREWHSRAKQGAEQSCIVFMELDHLRAINNAYGHEVGDQVLVGTVRYLTEHLRSKDKVFRYGGNEFLISLPGADLATCQTVIARVREGLTRRLLIVTPGGIALHVTASFGLALLDPDVGVIESIDRADQALLLAKAAGRNRAISWDPSVTTGKQLRRLKIDDTQA
jgi:diguanylate cyclase (GGDEF)-like protein